jgi:hypothetical protein
LLGKGFHVDPSEGRARSSLRIDCQNHNVEQLLLGTIRTIDYEAKLFLCWSRNYKFLKAAT